MVEDLQKVKHKWPDNYSSSKIEERYQCPDSDEGNAEDSILIGKDCVNQQLYETILKLSVLMYQKYGTTRGMVVRAKMFVPSINFLDKDVELVNKTKEGSNIGISRRGYTSMLHSFSSPLSTTSHQIKYTGRAVVEIVNWSKKKQDSNTQVYSASWKDHI